MTGADPNELFPGRLLVIVPHMDDCVLACGGTIAKVFNKERVHIIYATDGMKSPEPLFPWRDKVSPDLGEVRMQEAMAAMGYLGVRQKNIDFWLLPEGQLSRHSKALSNLLVEAIKQLEPRHIFIPFRYDRHLDHIAINHAITKLYLKGIDKFEVIEYFVYYKWRLLPKGDVREYIRPGYLCRVNISEVSAKKRAALDFFKSQTTRFYPWQARPTLSPDLLDSVSQAPEIFLRFDPSVPGPTIFNNSTNWIRFAHRVEPILKKRKDQALAFWRRGFPQNDRDSE